MQAHTVFVQGVELGVRCAAEQVANPYTRRDLLRWADNLRANRLASKGTLEDMSHIEQVMPKPEVKTRSAKVWTPEERAAQAERMRQRWTPEFRAAHAERMFAYHAKRKAEADLSGVRRGVRLTDAERERRRERMKALWESGKMKRSMS